MKILIISTEDSCRSQMAQAFLQSFDKSLRVISAGTNPSKHVNSFTIKAMQEVGIDINQNAPMDVNQYLSDDWDYVFTVCNNANRTCPSFTGKVNQRWHLAFDNPAEATGESEEILNSYRVIRDEIREAFFAFYNSQILGIHSCGCK